LTQVGNPWLFGVLVGDIRAAAGVVRELESRKQPVARGYWLLRCGTVQLPLGVKRSVVANVHQATKNRVWFQHNDAAGHRSSTV